MKKSIFRRQLNFWSVRIKGYVLKEGKFHRFFVRIKTAIFNEEREKTRKTKAASKWYWRGVKKALKGKKYDQKNYEYYYDFQEHYEPYERKGLKYFEKAADCFKRSAEFGHDLAMINYAVYLFAFKEEFQEALKCFCAASDMGLALADYELSVFYKTGYCNVEINDEKAEYYYRRYQTRCAEDKRQQMLASDIDEERGVIGRAYMYNWFCGYSFPEIYDTPRAKPSKWKYNR